MSKFWLKTFLVAALASPLIPQRVGAASNDDFQKAKAEAVEVTVNGRGPFGGLNTLAALSRAWSVSSFYTDWTGSGRSRTPYWVVRRATGGMRTPTAVQWADSRSCPSVRPMLETLEALPAPVANIPGLGRPRELSLVTDGESHELWLNFAVYPNDARGGLRIDGNVDSPIAAWWRAALPELKDCWSRKVPD
ncbi:hypothetical protein [Caulobacter sp.]|uniref:hypothetical protein n=1 Tax=Caulobacter sp. TaxID=78 RepID=UPI003BB1D39C